MNSRVITKLPVEDISDEDASLICGGVATRNPTSPHLQVVTTTPTTSRIDPRPEPGTGNNCHLYLGYLNGQPYWYQVCT